MSHSQIGHLHVVRAVLRLAIEVLEMVKRQHVAGAAGLVVEERREVVASVCAQGSPRGRALRRVHIEVGEGVLVAHRDIDRVGGVDRDAIPVASIGRGLGCEIIAVLDRWRAHGDAIEQVKRVEIRKHAGIRGLDKVNRGGMVDRVPRLAIDVVRPRPEVEILDPRVRSPRPVPLPPMPVARGNAKAALPTFQPGKYPAVPLGVVFPLLSVGVTGQG